jgi:hypothetical protein
VILTCRTAGDAVGHAGPVADAPALAAKWWPDHDWAGATAQHGAFHEVLVIAGDVVARLAKQPEAGDRVAGAHRTLSRITAAGRWPIPTVVGDVRRTADGRCGMLTTWLPGVHREDATWPEVAGELGALLRALASGAVLRVAGDLPPPRAWCGGARFPDIVRKDLVPALPTRDGQAAMAVIAEMEAAESGAVPVHGDLGMHNIMWDTQGRIQGLIDLDHAAVGDPAIDVAPLLGRFGWAALTDVVEPDVLRRAMLHRATLSLQVAAAGWLVGDRDLRAVGLGNFVRRRAAGTLYDPTGRSPRR